MSREREKELDQLIGKLEAEVAELDKKLKHEREKLADIELFIAGGALDPMKPASFRLVRVMKRHQDKVLCANWGKESRRIVSSSKEGSVVVWDAGQDKRIDTIVLPTTWVNACALSPSGELLAAGGMDNKCALFRVREGDGDRDKSHSHSSLTMLPYPSEEGRAPPLPSPTGHTKKVVAIHTSFLSHCQFPHSDNQLITASGDGTTALWDIESTSMIQAFHSPDSILTVDIPQDDSNLLATAGCDQVIRIWDVRTDMCVQTFRGHTDDVNDVKWSPTGDAICSASDDSTIRLFDLRADAELGCYQRKPVMFSCNTLDFSMSGRLIFGGYNDYLVHLWDTMQGVKVGCVFAHENRVTSLRRAPDGTAFATCSWDNTVKVWA